MPYVVGGRLDRQQRVAALASDQGQLDGLASFPPHLPPVTPVTDFPNPRTILTEARNRTSQLASDQGQLDWPANFPSHQPSFNPFTDFPNPNGWAVQRYDRTRTAQIAQEQGTVDWPQTLSAPFFVKVVDQPNPRSILLEARNRTAQIASDPGQLDGPASFVGLPPLVQGDQPNPVQRPRYFHDAGPVAVPFVVTSIVPMLSFEQPNPTLLRSIRHEPGPTPRLVPPPGIMGLISRIEQPNPFRPLRLPEYTWINVGLRFPASLLPGPLIGTATYLANPSSGFAAHTASGLLASPFGSAVFGLSVFGAPVPDIGTSAVWSAPLSGFATRN